MDRAAKLAAEAREFLQFERHSALDSNLAREATRECLVEVAQCLGFAPNEISSAIDQALTDAGVGR